jgi:hypothetical protein
LIFLHVCRDLAARLPWRERNHPLWLARRDGKG